MYPLRFSIDCNEEEFFNTLIREHHYSEDS